MCKSYIFLVESQIYSVKDTKNEKSSIHWFTSKIATVTGAELI